MQVATITCSCGADHVVQVYAGRLNSLPTDPIYTLLLLSWQLAKL